MANNDYMIDLKISGDDLNHVDKLIKFISSEQSTRNHILQFNKLLEKELFKNEHYIIIYYIDFMCSIKNLPKVDLSVINRLVALDKEMFVDIPSIELSTIAVVSEDKSGLIEQMVVEKINEIEALEIPSEEEFNLSVSVLKEIIRDLRVQNLIYTSSVIFYDGKKIGRELLKGRDGYIKFVEQGIMAINRLSDSKEDIVRVDREYMLTNDSSSKPLFDYPLPTLTGSWGQVREGDSISILAIQNVGKTTLGLNFLAESLIAKINSALFISEMSFSRVMSRLISIIGARKYEVKLPSNKIGRYLEIDSKKFKGKEITEGDKAFLSENEQLINNAEYILNAIFSDSNKELGTLYRKEDLFIESLNTDFELMREQGIKFILIDHVNGIRSRYPMDDYKRVDNAYVMVNSLGKKYGIANAITNHIPEEQKTKILDKNADLSNLRGARSTESTRSPDYVLILDATMEQKSRGEFVVSTNKDRNSNTFFEPTLTGIHTDVGMVYEIEIE